MHVRLQGHDLFPLFFMNESVPNQFLLRIWKIFLWLWVMWDFVLLFIAGSHCLWLHVFFFRRGVAALWHGESFSAFSNSSISGYSKQIRKAFIVSERVLQWVIFKIYINGLVDLSLKKQSLIRTHGMNCSSNLMTVRGTRSFKASYATLKN
jgi:hypothetical protein